MNQQENKCACCAAVQKGNLTFVIGAKRDVDSSDWVLTEGTSRLVCAACYPEESRRGKELIERYIARFNARAKALST